MMLTFFRMLILAIIYNFSEINCGGVPYVNFFSNLSISNESITAPSKVSFEYFKDFDYKLNTLSQVVNKMDNALQNLQEKSHNWAIFQHHINSWNEGIRILENKLDLIKRTHEEQHQQLQRLEHAVAQSHERYEFLFDDVKNTLISERKSKNDISAKINNILRLVELLSVANNGRKASKAANIMAPINVSSVRQQFLYENFTKKIEQRLNNLSHQMALQRDLKHLSSLEKRNFKSLENINQVLSNQLDKYNEGNAYLRKSNQCCYGVSGKLSTFTESSFILLKRIETLFRIVNEKLYDIQVRITDDDHSYENVVEGEQKISTQQLEENGDKESEQELEESVTENFEYYDSNDIEFLRPMLSGCHELIDELMDVDVNDNDVLIDGIYKFLSPLINEDERDFNERYCVFVNSPNDTGTPWTVIQRRGPYQQQENFNRTWSDYRNGFGHLSKDFWFGNEFIHRLVYDDDYELRIELEDFEGSQKFAEYAVFRIDSEKNNYNLLIGDHRGTVQDAMKYHNDNDFSTYDKRNDQTVDACCSCAMGYASGWWFDNCSEANLNGIYHNSPLGHNYIGIIWELWRGDYSLKKTRMMIRPRTDTISNSHLHSAIHHNDTEDP